jgi:hypothetical protein
MSPREPDSVAMAVQAARTRGTASGSGPEKQLALLLGLGVFFFYFACAGGRIVASDEHTMFLLTQSLVERGRVDVREGNGELGPDGRLYPKAGLGQAVASAPFYLIGRAAATAAPERMKPFVLRASTSLVMAAAGALLAALAFLAFLELGLTPREAVGLSLVLAFGTPLFVYAKLYLSEALLACSLTAGALGVLRLRAGGGARAGVLAGAGFGLALLTKYAVAPAVFVLALPAFLPPKRWRPLAVGAVTFGLFVAAAALYNETRTGSLLGSGYGRQGTLAAFTTPPWVGLYGLLLSSGKGLIWFAPIVVLAPAGFVAWWRRDRVLALCWIAACVVSVLLYAGFEHWAGDGSWGPRYLVPLVPILVIAIGARLGERARPRRRAWWIAVAALGVLGLAVNLGGVAIYFGAQMREAGEYPYQLPLNDPRFLADSHWNPRYTPIGSHWSMLVRNAGEHARGRWPRIEPTMGQGRIGLDDRQALSLTHGFDLWPAYAIYAGLPRLPVLAVWAAIWLLAFATVLRVFREASWLSPRAATFGAPPEGPTDDIPRYAGDEPGAKPRWSMTGPK